MPRGAPNRQTCIALDPDVDAKLKVLLANPTNGRMRYGSLSAIINSLLLNWAIKELEARSKKGSTP